MLTFAPALDGYHDVCSQWIDSLRKQAREQSAARAARKAVLNSVAAFEAYRAEVRAHYLRAIGGLPMADGEARPPLQPQITGTIQRNGYRIEKLLYQSLPKFYVTASLYVPHAPASPGPAVLFLCGHAELAKAYPNYQAVCVDLAMNGFVVLAMDPPGQGERFQYWDPETGQRLIGGCTTEHTYAGLPFMLQGASVARHFTWDAIRAIDYLCSRPEVDAQRIGVTGNSGGGTQTAFLMLAEPRLAAAVPCTFIMTLESYLATGQAQDSEQLIAGSFLHGPDHDDYLTAMAPKPVLVGAAAYDFFPIEGSLEAVARAKEVYRLYGAAENVEIVVSPHQHEYTALLREAAVNWFRRHLAGAEPDFRTGEPDVLPPEALQVTSSGQVLQEFPAARTLFHLALELAQDRRRQTASAGPPRREPEVLRRELAGALGIAGASRAAPIYPRVIHESVVDGYAVEKVFFFSEPGVCVAGVLIHPPGGAAVRTDILLLENGTASVPEERPRIEGLLAKGSRVLVFDPRGVGAVESRSFPGRAPHDLEWRLGCDAMLLGTSTLGQRVYDVLRALDWLRAGRPDVDPAAVALHGVGSGAVWAWYAAALEPGFCALTVENMLYSAQSLVETRYYDNRRYGLKNLGYGLLPGFDFGDLLPALAPRPVRILHPLDARGEIITPEDYAARVLTEALVGILPAGWSPDVE